jgi:hypothetical protein
VDNNNNITALAIRLAKFCTSVNPIRRRDVPGVLEMLRISLEHLNTAVIALQTENEQLHRELDDTRSVIMQVEWVPLPAGESGVCYYMCGWCKQPKAEGHSLDCRRQAALKQDYKAYLNSPLDPRD